jgi:myosin heavy subunit
MAESGKITREDIIAKDAFTSAVEEAKELLKVVTDIQNALKTKAKQSTDGFAIASPQTLDDVAKLTKQIEDLKKQIAALEAVTEKQKKATKDLTAAQAQENLARQKQRQEITQQVKLNSDLTSTYEKQVVRLAQIKKELKNISAEGGKAPKALTDEFKKLDTSVRKAEEAVGEHQRSVGNYKQALTGLSGPLGNAANGISGMGQALKGLLLNPVALAIAAVAAAVYGLFKAFTSTDSGATEWAVRLEQVSAIIDVVKNRALLLIDAIVALFSGDFTEAAQKFGQAVSANGDDFARATDGARKYIEELDKLEDAQSNFLVQSAKMSLQISKLEFDAADRKFSTEQRRKALTDALELSKQQVEQEKAFAEQLFIIEAEKLESLTGVDAVRLAQYVDMSEAEKENASDELKIARNNYEDKFKLLNELGAKVYEIEQRFYDENKKKNAKIAAFDEQIEKEKQEKQAAIDAARQKDAERRAELNENQRKKELEAERVKYEKELKEAKKNGEDIELVKQVHTKNKLDINTKFNAKEAAEFDKREAERKAKERKAQQEELDLEQEKLSGKISIKDEEEAILLEATEKNYTAIKTAIDEEYNLKAEKLEKQKVFELSNKDLTENEKLLIEEKYKNDSLALAREKAAELKGINEKEKEDKKKLKADELAEERKVQQQVLQGIEQGTKRRSEIVQNGLNAEIKKQDEAVQRQQELAAKGLDNTLAYQEKKREELQAKLEREKEAERRREEALQLAGAFLGSYQSRLDNNQSTTAALAGALADTLIAKAISSTIAGAFAGGVEDFQGKGTGTSDSNLIAFSHGESVVTAKATQQYSGLVTAMNKGLVDDYVKQMILPDMDAPMKSNGNSFQSAAIVYTLTKELGELKQAIKNKQEIKVNWNAQGERVEEIVKDGMKTVIKHVTTGKRRL